MPISKIDASHKVTISSQTGDIVEGWIPESFNFTINSEWRTPLAASSPLSDSASLLLSSFGVSAIAEWMTVAVWSGSSPIEIEIPLIFVAEEEGSARSKVLGQVKKLNKMTLPSKRSGGFLIPPGPSPVGIANEGSQKFFKEYFGGTSGEIITIRIGKFLEFNKVIILGVSTEFYPVLEIVGFP
jgi:hypothetical protein